MKTDHQSTYEQLGYLFYAIASADKNVRKEETTKLKNLITREWLPLEKSTDEFGTDAGHYISIAFDYLVNRGMSPGEAFQSFAEYYRQHPADFQKPIKRKISATAMAIANSFAGINKKEREYISQLHILMS